MRPILLRALCAAILAFSIVVQANAQMPQYTAPGGFPDSDADPQQILEEEMEDARWRLGPVRLVPWIGVRDIAWVDNVFAGSEENISDVTASVAAGLAAYLPLGQNVTLLAEAQPEYIWWRDLTDRRQLVGRYGTGIFAFFNRLRFQLQGTTEETQTVASTEFPQRILVSQDRLRTSLDLKVRRGLWLFATGELVEIGNQSEDPNDPRALPFQTLDREETVLRGGIRFELANDWKVSLGLERTEVDFNATSRNLSNEGTSPTLEIGHEDAVFRLDARLSARSLEPIQGSEFVAFDELSGSFVAEFKPVRRVDFEVYGFKNPVYSLLEDYIYFDDQRLGVALSSQISRNFRVRVFAEEGDSSYVLARPDAADRLDDVQAVGADLVMSFGESLGFSLGVIDTTIDSNLPGFDRDLTTFRTGLTLSAPNLLWR